MNGYKHYTLDLEAIEREYDCTTQEYSPLEVTCNVNAPSLQQAIEAAELLMPEYKLTVSSWDACMVGKF